MAPKRIRSLNAAQQHDRLGLPKVYLKYSESKTVFDQRLSVGGETA